MVLDNVDRIPAPSAEVFYHEYLLAQRPVILTDLFAESSLHRCNTLDAVKAVIGEVPIQIHPNYIAHLLGTTETAGSRLLPLGSFLEWIQAQSSSLDMCAEYPTPAVVTQQLPLPHYRHLSDEQDLYSNMFVAAAGNSAHLHYDADQRQVLLYQVFGTKRVVMIDPRHTQKLDPIDQANLCRTSGVFLENLSEPEKLEFLRYTHAWDTIVYPGETIFMPAMIWHYLEYLDPAMSIGYRLGRNSYNRRLAALFPVPSIDVQALAIALLDQTKAQAHHALWLDELEHLSRSLQGNPAERKAVLDRRCLSIREQLGLEPVTHLRELARRQALQSPVANLAHSRA